ncbi:MAG: hypothetical protein AB1482_10055 [Pseudomonadota bacterium]
MTDARFKRCPFCQLAPGSLLTEDALDVIYRDGFPGVPHLHTHLIRAMRRQGGFARWRAPGAAGQGEHWR